MDRLGTSINANTERGVETLTDIQNRQKVQVRQNDDANKQLLRYLSRYSTCNCLAGSNACPGRLTGVTPAALLIDNPLRFKKFPNSNIAPAHTFISLLG